ncbi:nitroreductase/quinone reductase family protein, partial [Actinocorallia lasiicapitis]
MGIIEALYDSPHWAAAEPPRVPFGGRAELGAAAWLASRAVGAAAGVAENRLVQVLALTPGPARAYLPFGNALVPRSVLGRTRTELITLRATWNVGGRYEFFHHVFLSRPGGISIETVERITRGPRADGLNEEQRALLTACDELYAARALSASTREWLTRFLSPDQIRDLCLLVGHYEMLAMLLKSAGAEPEPGAWESGPLRWLRSADDGDRLMPDWPSWFRKGANAVIGSAAPYLPPYSMVVHKGRRSGTVRRTPVLAVRNGNKVIVFVMYGDRSDWVRNLLAEGRGGWERAGRLHRISRFKVTDVATDGGLVPARYRPAARLVKLLIAELEDVEPAPPRPSRLPGSSDRVLPA